MPYLKPATLAEAMVLSQDLRPEDEAEVRAISGKEPQEALIDGIRFSDFPIAIMDDDDTVIGMFGAVPALSKPRTGIVWMLASPKLLKHRIRFAKESRQWIDALQTHYDILSNVVDERNTVHIRWLQWCGFTFINRYPEFGLAKLPFIEFVRIKDQHV